VAYNLHEYQILPETREIFLHRHIHDESGDDGDDCGIDYRSATRFIQNLCLLNAQSSEPIFVHMQSRGGDWNDGMAIYDAIRASRASVTILAYAHARSMSSVILQAATVRVLMPTAIFLVHEGYFCAGEDRVRGLLTAAQQEQKDLQTMLTIYATRCKDANPWKGMDQSGIVKAIHTKMRKEEDWILSAQEAVRYGFADGVLGTKGWKSVEEIRRRV
jgi:ATP-dependent protease ClpP protease subunit